MRRLRFAAVLALAVSLLGAAKKPAAMVTVDYPIDGSIFPPDIAAPTFLWRDAAQDTTEWRIEVTFANGAKALRVKAAGDLMQVGEIDPRCVSETNNPPALRSEERRVGKECV